MKRLLLLVFSLVSIQTWSQGIQLSTSAEISVITCGPSQRETYLAFGHSAIRVYDPVNNIDYAYNYGVFDFDQPNFYFNYTRGLLNFKLGVYEFRDFLNSYIYYNRWVNEQVLDLSITQKQQVFNYLEWNALPENDTYLYDYFYNNCANKVRDVFAGVLKDSLQFDGSYITTNYTIRQLTDICLVEQPWGDLGIDICLGLPMDKKATPYEYMFLPDYVESSFDHATINRGDTIVPIVKRKIPLFVSKPQATEAAPVHPWVVFGGFLLIAVSLSAYDLKRRKVSRLFDLILFGVCGLLGWLLTLLWFGTNHAAAANNFNILWALPTHVFVFVIFRNRSVSFLRKYFSVVTVITTLLILTWFVLPQQMNVFLLPFVGAILIRSFVLARLL